MPGSFNRSSALFRISGTRWFLLLLRSDRALFCLRPSLAYFHPAFPSFVFRLVAYLVASSKTFSLRLTFLFSTLSPLRTRRHQPQTRSMSPSWSLPISSARCLRLVSVGLSLAVVVYSMWFGMMALVDDDCMTRCQLCALAAYDRQRLSSRSIGAFCSPHPNLLRMQDAYHLFALQCCEPDAVSETCLA